MTNPKINLLDIVMSPYLLALDQGTTNSRAIIFDRAGLIVSSHDLPLEQFYPHPGWVEQDPAEMLRNIIACVRAALLKAQLTAEHIAAVGISNQRETTIIWDKKTGQPIYPAIVWQDRRTSDTCREMKESPFKKAIEQATGLLIDPYFSATKIMWLLANVPAARTRAEAGELLFGTVETYLIWHLTQGAKHITDITNASRTLLFNIYTQQWDKEILSALQIPKVLLPVVTANVGHFGDIDASFFGRSLPITGMAGDQQAATVGQACFQPGMIKSTYGTGCFMLLNTGKKVIPSQHALLQTIAYQVDKDLVYGLEGSIFSAGITVKWLRDQMQVLTNATETETLASEVEDTGGVYFIPAFTGLGAPYWQPDVRGAILGITLGTRRAHLIRAALESIAYQTRDLLLAMQEDSQMPLTTLRVDGGMSANNWFLQFLADILNLTVERPLCIETTALGAAYLAGLGIGFYDSLEEVAALWRSEKKFEPHMSEVKREALYAGWQQAVGVVLSEK